MIEFDGACSLECAQGMGIALIGIGYLGDSPNDVLCGKAKGCSGVVVGEGMKVELPKGLVLEGDLADTITGGVAGQ